MDYKSKGIVIIILYTHGIYMICNGSSMITTVRRLMIIISSFVMIVKGYLSSQS